MTYLPSPAQGFLPYSTISDAAPAKAPARSTPKRSFWQILLGSLVAARRRQADQEIARYLALKGGTLSDSAERDIERTFLR